jgi:hypothetical protein
LFRTVRGRGVEHSRRIPWPRPTFIG